MPQTGSVWFDGREFKHTPPHHRARLGLTRSFQNLELFESLTVLENILTAIDRKDMVAYVSCLVRPGRRELPPMAIRAIQTLGLEKDLDVLVSELPHGRRRLVAMARMLALDPKAVCLDEPAAGLADGERRSSCELIRNLADDFGLAVLIVEHNLDVVGSTCDEVIAIDFGREIGRGTPAEVLALDSVRTAYLGEPSLEVPANSSDGAESAVSQW
jgi:sulfate-transporting ATPase